jgi:hypothetical protein
MFGDTHRGGVVMNRKFRTPTYGAALLGLLLVGCAISAPDPKKPGDEALTCPQLQAEIDAQDATARREAAKVKSLQPGATAYSWGEYVPFVGSLLSLVDLPTDASGSRAMARAGSARDDALVRSDYLRRLEAQRCSQAAASREPAGAK